MLAQHGEEEPGWSQITCVFSNRKMIADEKFSTAVSVGFLLIQDLEHGRLTDLMPFFVEIAQITKSENQRNRRGSIENRTQPNGPTLP